MIDHQEGLRYRDAGVNIDAATEALSQIKTFINRTFDDNVLRDIGSFGAMYQLSPGTVQEPVLVSSVDGVGTKLKIAFMMNRHDTVGVDLVSHCVNDILVQGAKPLFFLDYLACGKLEPDVVVEVLRGVTNGCRYAGCALIGGETAEMPDMYKVGEYDLAGTIVGIVDRNKIVDGSKVGEGDVLVGLASSGLHTNGYSLARKICFDVAGLSCTDPMPGVGRNVGDALLEPHRSYAKVINILGKIVEIHAMAHITGGGLTDNVPRVLPEGLGVEIALGSWEVPPLFQFLQKTGRVSDLEMLRTFNMGIGYVVIVPERDLDRTVHTLNQGGETNFVIGRVVRGEQKVSYTGSPRYAPSH
jgi:phosphoribosylformylglycinamidine cyclo-ligase